MKYTLILLADPEKGYTALVPAFPDCVSEGDSKEEAMDMILEAIQLCSESAEQHGEEIPAEIEGTLIGQVDTATGKFWVKNVGTLSKSRVS